MIVNRITRIAQYIKDYQTNNNLMITFLTKLGEVLKLFYTFTYTNEKIQIKITNVIGRN